MAWKNVKAIIQDVWGESGAPSEVRVAGPEGTACYPYEDSSQRVDQLRNARRYAEGLSGNGLVTDVLDLSEASHQDGQSPLNNIEQPHG